jgi:transitional endoplasmic reticulum ATPase
MLAKAIAHHAGAHFIAATSSDILSKWYGESEKQIVRIFNRARQVAPTILFFDEIDALAPWRGVGLGEPAVIERVVNTLLAEMDALEDVQDVVIIGATNRPTLLDHALLRPGRFDELIYVPVPDKEGRVKILQIHTRNMQLSSDVNLEDIAERTIRYTGADLQNLVRRAGLRALREEKKVVEVSRKYFEFALDETRASVNTEMEEEYTRLIDMLKRESPRARPRIGFLP